MSNGHSRGAPPFKWFCRRTGPHEYPGGRGKAPANVKEGQYKDSLAAKEFATVGCRPLNIRTIEKALTAPVGTLHQPASPCGERTVPDWVPHWPARKPLMVT